MIAHLKIQRHRAYQIIISCGLIGSCVIALIDPAYAMHSVLASTVSSLLWLWE